jgi:hypothetical protein
MTNSSNDNRAAGAVGEEIGVARGELANSDAISAEDALQD